MRAVRLLILGLFLALPFTGTIDASGVSVQPVVAAAAPEDAPAAPKAPDIDVNIGGGDRVVWYTNPILLAAGVAGVLLVVVLIAMAARGGGTTIVHEK